METPGHNILVARVLSEDDKFMTLEVAKDDNTSFTLDPDPNSPDRFFMVIFVHPREDMDNTLEAWKPWLAE